MKRNYPNVNHQFDVWQNKKDCSELSPWIKSVSNHLWWCTDTCEGSKELLREKWISLSTTLQIFTTGILQTCIMSVPTHLSLELLPEKEVATAWAPAHEALKEVVFNKTLLKDVQQLTFSCHTGQLEVYHSVQTKYLPKQQHFSYKGMVARTQLAARDHNANTGRKQATSSKGESDQ